MDDTIVGISTALGIGAISIIRVSGDDSINIVNKIFKGKNLTKVDSHTINYGHIVDNDEVIDEVLISVMLAPRSYTTEDIVEVNCHGGIATTNKILELIIKNGARLAEPGEFTKRAFLNGRIDLIEADGIMNLIESKSDAARKLAVNQLGGKVSLLINNLRDKLVQVISNIEVNIDYPEYDDVDEITNEKVLPVLKDVYNSLLDMIKLSRNGKLIKGGINVCLVGRPNVGKSSLLNSLLEEDRAIVTDIAGTTRDIVEGSIQLDGIVLNLIDTAGIRNTNNLVEKIGVEKSKDAINNSDLVLLVLNNNEVLNEEDRQLLNLIKNKTHILVINKIDLEKKIDIFGDNNIVEISAEHGLGIDELKAKIKELFNFELIEQGDMNYLTNARSIGLLEQSVKIIEDIFIKIDSNVELYLIELDIKEVWNILGEIIGATYKEELLDEMFKRFCLGK